MRFLQFLLSATGLVLTVLLAAGWLQTFHDAFDSISHFRLVFAAILLPVSLGALLFRHWKIPVLAVLAITISLWLSAPFLPGFGATSPDYDFRIVQFNMLFRNYDTDKISEALAASDADVFILQELGAGNRKALGNLKEMYPYQLECALPGWGSVAMASRHPFVDAANNLCSRRIGFLKVKLDINDKCVTVASLHAKWPWPFPQRERLELIKPHIENITGPRILAGDFNAASWSAVVQRVAGWLNGTVAPGLVLSWSPQILEINLDFGLLLPLDQVMQSSDLQPLNRRRLPNAGSDHRPIVTDYLWTVEGSNAKTCP